MLLKRAKENGALGFYYIIRGASKDGIFEVRLLYTNEQRTNIRTQENNVKEKNTKYIKRENEDRKWST